MRYHLKYIKTESTASKETGLSGVKLPKNNVPTFDGKVISCRSFWEQFDASIQCKTGLNDTKKLMYMQKILKNGQAKFFTPGLTCTTECYEEAIKC